METCRNCIYCHQLKRRSESEWEYSNVCIMLPITENNGYDDWALELNDIDNGVICESFIERGEQE